MLLRRGDAKVCKECLRSFGPILSQPLDCVGSRDDNASSTSESEVQMHDEGRGRVLMLGREKGLLVKTEWKKVLKNSTFPASEVTLLLPWETVEVDSGFHAKGTNVSSHISCHHVIQ